MLSREGLSATTTRKIAAEAGVNQAMLGYYFGSKDDLFFAVLETLMDHARHLMVATLTPQRDMRHMIAQCITAFWQSFAAAPEVQVMQMELTLYALRQPESAWLAKQQYAGYGAVIETLLRDAYTEAQQTCAVRFDALARFIMGGLDGLILQFASDRDGPRASSDLQLFIAAVLALAEGTTPLSPDITPQHEHIPGYPY